jgi:hypothetical protein
MTLERGCQGSMSEEGRNARSRADQGAGQRRTWQATQNQGLEPCRTIKTFENSKGFGCPATGAAFNHQDTKVFTGQPRPPRSMTRRRWACRFPRYSRRADDFASGCARHHAFASGNAGNGDGAGILENLREGMADCRSNRNPALETESASGSSESTADREQHRSPQRPARWCRGVYKGVGPGQQFIK